MEFINNNWIALLSLAIVLIGGIPGILQAITYLRNRPEFHFTVHNITTGESDKESDNKTTRMIFIVGTVANAGNAPLSPASFDLFLDINGKWVRMNRFVIPDNIKFNHDTIDVIINNPSSFDLQKYSGAIHLGTPVHGYLMFTSRDISATDLRNHVTNRSSVKLVCNDIYAKEHKIVFQIKGQEIISSLKYPKHDIAFTQKT